MGSCSCKNTRDLGIQVQSAPNEIVTAPVVIPARPTTPEIILDPVDISDLDRIVNDADFSSIVDDDIDLELEKIISKKHKPPTSNGKGHPSKDSQSIQWNNKYFVHGKSSDIVAEVKNDIHGCIESFISEDINIYISYLCDIDRQANQILENRCKQISNQEQQIIDQIVLAQQTLIAQLIQNGRSKMDLSERYYQTVIEGFLAKLQVQMSKHLDSLQQQLDKNKTSIFSASTQRITNVTNISRNAKQILFERLQLIVDQQRLNLLKKLDAKTKEHKSQTIGYEQLRKLDVSVYSTVGLKQPGQVCDNIPNRDRYGNDIKLAKPNQPIKRTVYLGTGTTVL